MRTRKQRLPRACSGLGYKRKRKQENKRTIRLAKENTSNKINIDQAARNSFENVTEQDILQKAQSEIDDKTIKDFPFKNNWYELATRRLIRYAADNNFEAIAIPEGRVAAARYGKVGGFADNLEISVFRNDSSRKRAERISYLYST